MSWRLWREYNVLFHRGTPCTAPLNPTPPSPVPPPHLRYSISDVDGSISWWGRSWCYLTIPTDGGFGFISLDAGANFMCALDDTGAIGCWGQNNKYGQLNVPDAVANGGQMAVAVGRFHACALDTTGAIACWGSNTKGETVPPHFTEPQVSLSAGEEVHMYRWSAWARCTFVTLELHPPVASPHILPSPVQATTTRAPWARRAAWFCASCPPGRCAAAPAAPAPAVLPTAR